jgi:hypothetical protein
MPTPRTPYEAVLHAARDVARLDCAFDAEMLGTALLGSVYAVAESNRAAAVRSFVGGFLTATARRRTPAAATIRQVFAALVADAPGFGATTAGAAVPAWSTELGRVKLTGSYAYGDVYGDQTSYVATFAYDDPHAGGPEHAVVVLVDHNIGIAKDVFVGGPATAIVGQVRELCAKDELTWFSDADPAELRGAVAEHMAITDELTDLPAEGSLATDRALVGARLALLPEPAADAGPAAPQPLSAARRAVLTQDFLASPEAAGAGFPELGANDLAALQFCLSLVLDHADTFPDVDPLRWSPAVVGLFLLDWVHRRAVLDEIDVAMLPRALRAWVAYAGRRRGLPAPAAAQTVDAVDEMAPEFARLHATGERRSPATAAVAQLIAEGIDPHDPVAVDSWMQANVNGGRANNS